MASAQRQGGSRSPPTDATPFDRTLTSDLDVEGIDELTNETNYYGDLLEPKQKNVFRGVSVQVGGLPIDPTDPKYETFIQAVLDHDVDVVAIQEVGINFNYAGVNGQWKKRLGWNSWLNGHRSKTVNAWNTTDHVKSTTSNGCLNAVQPGVKGA